MNEWHTLRFAPAPGTPLCAGDAIAEGATKEFRFGGNSPFAFRLFIYNDNGIFRAFRNNCPHFDVPLNYAPDEIFTPDHRYFRCMTHNARFDKSTGNCVDGPCMGQALEPIPLALDAGMLLVGAITDQ